MASAKVDNNRNSLSKRSRNDAAKNDGDWTCPQCGNVNFGFRTVCNRGKCGAPRPPTTPRMGSAPHPSNFEHAPPIYFGGAGAPPPLPGYGPPIPYAGIRYDYRPPGAMAPYGLMPPYAPPGPMGGIGFGRAPAMDGYGFGFRGSPLPVPAPWSDGGLPDNNASRKRRGGPDGLSEGDWVCPKCDNVNFAFRTTCNMKKCGTPRPTSCQVHCGYFDCGLYTMYAAAIILYKIPVQRTERCYMRATPLLSYITGVMTQLTGATEIGA